jgi:quinohemoprotein ethanol dehydrogenase
VRREGAKVAIRGLARLGACAAVALSIIGPCAAIAETAGAGAPAIGPAAVTDARLIGANAEPGEWLSVGRTENQQRFSPLTQIDASNVSRLGLAWYADFDTNRSQEGTPLEIDGVLYLSTAWSKVRAYDARTGRLIWAFDPKVPGQFAGRGCCDVVNRGLAAWRGRIYVATYDGRLIALDARTGKPIWSVLTVDHSWPYTITGAPRIAKARVLIGNAGGEFGVRGYISAYDAETGKLDWRFYTVPGNPAHGFEQPILAKAARTWHGDWWRVGGGGTVWNSIAYDPKLNLVYFGTGNGVPWNRKYRGTGGGDNLFVASIIAVNADTGAYVWHYQESPGEEWDYDATPPLMLATLKIAGRPRRVIMQASKNGFFYVLDASTGTLVSAKNFVPVNWTKGIDPETGRPIPNRATRYDLTGKPAVVEPGGQGAHAWHPISYSPLTGLLYFSAIDTRFTMMSAKTFDPERMASNLGIGFGGGPRGVARRPPPPSHQRLIAWNPVTQRAVWRSAPLGRIGAGTLATAGNLVFQGTTDGRFVAYRATDGKVLWSTKTETGVVAGPMTFALSGEQYVAVEAGYGLVRYGESNQSRLLVFKLGATASLPPAPPPPPPLVLNPPPSTASKRLIAAGRQQFARHCATCHQPPAANREVFPDLRYSPALWSQDVFDHIVLGGALQANGMASFKGILSERGARSVRAFLIAQANEAEAALRRSGAGRAAAR